MDNENRNVNILIIHHILYKKSYCDNKAALELVIRTVSGKTLSVFIYEEDNM